MGSLIDTSAIFAVLCADDESHEEATRVLARLDGPLVTHDLIVVEAVSLIDRRLGQAELDAFLDVMLPTIDVGRVDPALFNRSLMAFRARERRRLSFVDAVTIEFCRDRGIRDVFAFDEDLARAGLKAVRA